ncbi:hypothetical protein Tco_0295727 [Tanacetum coccineum]
MVVTSEVGIQVLEKQELFGKKSLGKLDVYDNHVLRKSHRVSFGVGRSLSELCTERVIAIQLTVINTPHTEWG